MEGALTKYLDSVVDSAAVMPRRRRAYVHTVQVTGVNHVLTAVEQAQVRHGLKNMSEVAHAIHVAYSTLHLYVQRGHMIGAAYESVYRLARLSGIEADLLHPVEENNGKLKRRRIPHRGGNGEKET